MKLEALLRPYTNVGLPDITLTAITNDSRQIVAGCLFLAEKGIASHGLDYLSEAQAELAAFIVYESDYNVGQFERFSDKMLALADLKTHVSALAKAFYTPRFSQSIIGVTGTNGKTSVSHFIAQLSDYGMIGTMGYGRFDALNELSHTTPDALSVQKILGELSTDFSGVAMEVSSHALVLNRVRAVDFSVAVFTNLSQDHLDFHKDMEDYFTAKAKLFDYDSVHTAVINTDDDFGYRLAKQCQRQKKRVLAFGRLSRVGEFAEYININAVQLSNQGIFSELSVQLCDCDTTLVLNSPVWGGFNVDNVIAAVLALYASGQQLPTLLDKAGSLSGVIGRIDPIDLGDNRVAIIDYSHTPDALDNVLNSLRAHTQGKLYAVFGCGGDRDKKKRPLMAEAVNRGADVGIITDDNPRTEQSDAIIKDILAATIEQEKFSVIACRKTAIRHGLAQLQSGDVLLIAGKGHETYQIIGKQKFHFSDHEVVGEWLAEQSGGVRR